MNRQPARPSLFPYTTLFRSSYIKLQGSQDFQVWPSDAAAQIGLRRFRPESIPLASKADVAASPHDARLIPEGGLSLCNCEQDRKSTRMNSSHPSISYAVFCL